MINSVLCRGSATRRQGCRGVRGWPAASENRSGSDPATREPPPDPALTGHAMRQSLDQLAASYRRLEVRAVLLALFHTGTSGIGARQPGGQGIRIDLAHPIKLDSVAAAHPDLTVVAAHFGWRWHMDLIAIALHKTNVYIDISGWSPRRIPAEVIRELRGRLSGQFLWGQRLPFLHARAVPVRARGHGPAGRGHDGGAARQRGAHPQLRSTTTGAWSDGPLPLRASRSTYAARTRSATARSRTPGRCASRCSSRTCRPGNPST